ncbi:MAG: pyridoxamine 5'-phosphate oxidase [Saprospiraceae bacterium]
MNRDIKDMRENYDKSFLQKTNLKSNPIDQFSYWFDEVKATNTKEPNAMILATSNSNGTPSLRTVLLKEMDAEGFVFYTNYNSQKAKDIAENPIVSLLFLWKEMERQVRITGLAEKISIAQSSEYFKSRPRGSKIGAWVSPQSEIIASREILESKNADIEAKFKDSEDIPLPLFWGGYIVKPITVEFWQGRPDRLHDRLKYSRKNKNWIISRLAP